MNKHPNEDVSEQDLVAVGALIVLAGIGLGVFVWIQVFKWTEWLLDKL